MGRVRDALRSLPAQMVLTSIALVLLTAVAAGLPAAWLVRGQAQAQAWARVRQGLRATEALYAAKHRELAALATVTAQRPTLRDLVAAMDAVATRAYLDDLRASAGLDFVALCGSDDAGASSTVWASSVPSGTSAVASVICPAEEPTGYFDSSAEVPERLTCASGAPSIWLFSSDEIFDPVGMPLGSVVVGALLDDSFTESLVEQSGLEQSIVVDGHVSATSLPCSKRTTDPAGDSIAAIEQGGQLSVGTRPHYYGRTPLSWVVPRIGGEAADVDIEVALPVSDLAAAERRLIVWLAAAILAVAVAGSLLAALLSRRISRPLSSLVDAAEALRGGELESAVPDVGAVREVSLVARALEEARRDLRRLLVELRDEKAWTDHLLDAIVEGIATLDDEGRITYFSPGAERITGWKRADAVGRPCGDVFIPAETDQPFTAVIPTPGGREMVTVRLGDDRTVTLAITGAEFVRPEAREDLTVLVFRDVTDTESMHRVMGHFLANVAHEFLTPLTALAASAELLMDQALDLQAEEIQQLLVALHVGILKLHTLVNNLLEGASIEAGRFGVSARPASLEDIVAEAVRTMQPLLERQDQQLAIDLPDGALVVRADPRRTTQVLVNLLSNASRYGPDDSEIVLGAVQLADHVRVRVADRGPGIPPDKAASVFHRFVYPGAGDDRSRYGAGLGLSVVKAIVEAQGGSVGVLPRDGGGSEFWFTIPLEIDT